MNPLFDAIVSYVDARERLAHWRNKAAGTDIVEAAQRVVDAAEANLRKVCAGVCRVDGEGLPGSVPPDNDRT